MLKANPSDIKVTHLADAGHVVVVVAPGEVCLHTPLQLSHVLTGAAAAGNLKQIRDVTSFFIISTSDAPSLFIFPIHRLCAIIMRWRS